MEGIYVGLIDGYLAKVRAACVEVVCRWADLGMGEDLLLNGAALAFLDPSPVGGAVAPERAVRGACGESGCDCGLLFRWR